MITIYITLELDKGYLNISSENILPKKQYSFVTDFAREIMSVFSFSPINYETVGRLQNLINKKNNSVKTNDVNIRFVFSVQ